MQRVLCVRFPNWPIQRYLRETAADTGESAGGVALHTPVPGESGEPAQRKGSASDCQERTRAAMQLMRRLYPSSRNAPTIVFVCPNAWTHGIRPGMTLAEARSMAAPVTRNSQRKKANNRGQSRRPDKADEVRFAQWNPAADDSALRSTAETARPYAPFIGTDESAVSDSLILDISGCGTLFGGESVLAASLLRACRKAGWDCTVAIAETAAIAWGAVHSEDTRFPPFTAGSRREQRRTPQDSDERTPIVIIPSGLGTEFAAPLPLSAGRIPLGDRDILSSLGITRLGQLLNLPLDDLPSRVSDDCLVAVRRLQGIEPELLVPMPESNPVRAQWHSEYPAASHAELTQLTHFLLEQLVPRLIQRQVGAVRIQCVMHAEDRSLLSPVTVECVRPSQSPEHLSELLDIRLRDYRMTTPVARAEMTATVMPMPAVRQQDLFSRTSHHCPAEELSVLVDRLTGHLGPDAVLTSRETTDERPESAVRYTPITAVDRTQSAERLRSMVTPTETDGTAAVRRRPVRLLAPPLPLPASRENSWPAAGEIHWQGFTHRIRGADGPERIETAWWEESPVARDYYCIDCDEAAFWIFRDLPSRQWFLHGLFD